MTKTYYQINGFLKHSEKDVYSEGCQPETSQSFFIDYLIQKESLSDLIQAIKDFTEAENDDLLLNSCDEKGRIDAQVLKAADDTRASEKDLELWREGKRDLYLCTYSAYVVQITETPATIEGI